MKTPRAPLAHFLGLLLALQPWHLSAEPVRAGHVQAELIAEQSLIQPGTPFWVALHLTADPGWHTYWENPGDSGLPTTIAWKLPDGFSAGAIQWPSPQVLQTLGQATYGYEGETALLVEIRPPADVRPGSQVVLRASASWLVCQNECQPGKADVELRLGVTADKVPLDGRWARVFSSFRKRLPVADPKAAVSAAISASAVTLTFDGVPEADFSKAYFFPASPNVASSDAPQTVSAQGTAHVIHMTRVKSADAPPSRLQGVLVLPGSHGARAVLVDVPLVSRSGAASSGPAFLLALLFAFLGGIILNLMPCVLPVLSLKVMSFVREAQSSRRGAAAHSLVFSSGVIVSFWILAGTLLALRGGGQLLGWGFQFQNPWVVVAAAVLFFLLGLSMFGVFEIGVRFTSLGSGLQTRKGWAGSFFSGFLVTAVATPCTAPFMGSALGYAFSQPPAVVLAVFTSLAVGMSLPFVALSVFPALTKRVPRPGRWMETLKQVMGFPLMASAVWMGSVLVSLSGPSALVILLGALVACGAAAWIFGRWGGLERPRWMRATAGTLATALAVSSLALAVLNTPAIPQGDQRTRAASVQQGGIAWEPYSAERLSELRTQGRPVFIDFTAAWCLTCKVNERIALQNDTVARRFSEKGIVALKADWTDRSDSIAEAIAGYGRAGVPLYALYAGGAATPVILPEIITPGIVLDAVSRIH